MAGIVNRREVKGKREPCLRKRCWRVFARARFFGEMRDA